APDLDKVMIVLTDGLNTQNRWTTSATSIDSRTSTICSNIKAANIRIYTVRVLDGNASLLQSCATKPDMYFDVQQADQLNSVFSAIAQTRATPRNNKEPQAASLAGHFRSHSADKMEHPIEDAKSRYNGNIESCTIDFKNCSVLRGQF